MLRFVMSLLVMLLGGSCSPSAGPAVSTSRVGSAASPLSRETSAADAGAGVEVGRAEPKRGNEPADPSLRERLSAVAVQPARFRDPSLKGFADARQLYQLVEIALQARHWGEEKRFPCPNKYDGSLGTDGEALVTDAHGKVRALTIVGGTDDHYREVRFFFDEAERLRLLFLRYADVQGGSAQNLVYFNGQGDVLACDKFSEKTGLADWDLCTDENAPVKVDGEVAQALRVRPRPKPRNRLREVLQVIHPRETFDKCAPR
jgi:hypothetical protein